MAATPSTMIALGTEARPFALPDVRTGCTVSLDDFATSKALLVMFICNHCPFVKHVADELAAIGRDYIPRNVGIVAINSNDIDNHPDDAPDLMKREAENRGFNFPYLLDETQETAKAYRAACTPDFFLFDDNRQLFYRGQLDGARPSNDEAVTGRDLRAAIDAALAGREPPPHQMQSIGCNIKWKPGNEPDYFA